MDSQNGESHFLTSSNQRRVGRGRALFVVLGCFLSAALVVGVIRSAPLAQIAAAWRQMALGLAIFAMALVAFNLWLRGGRWAVLFSSRFRVPANEAAAIAILGIALNAVLPGRPGEFARIGLASRRFHSGIAFTTATIIAERLLDAFTLLAFLGLSLMAMPHLGEVDTVRILDTELSGETVTVIVYTVAATALLLAACIVLLSLDPVRRGLIQLSSKIPLRIGQRIQKGFRTLLDNVHEGFGALRRPGSLIVLLGYSVGIWLLLATANWILAHGIPGIHLSIGQAFIFTAVSIAASSIPSAPGAWGVFEAGGLVALQASGIESEPGATVAFVLAAHLCQYIPSLIAGLALGFWRFDLLRPR